MAHGTIALRLDQEAAQKQPKFGLPGRLRASGLHRCTSPAGAPEWHGAGAAPAPAPRRRRRRAAPLPRGTRPRPHAPARRSSAAQGPTAGAPAPGRARRTPPAAGRSAPPPQSARLRASARSSGARRAPARKARARGAGAGGRRRARRGRRARRIGALLKWPCCGAVGLPCHAPRSKRGDRGLCAPACRQHRACKPRRTQAAVAGDSGRSCGGRQDAGRLRLACMQRWRP
jgi:hypothetical protein